MQFSRTGLPSMGALLADPLPLALAVGVVLPQAFWSFLYLRTRARLG